jgi:peptide chain release factor subunit 1
MWKEERMLSIEELKEIAKLRGDGSLFVSLYLNVNPATNSKDNYLIHLKNMVKTTLDGTTKPDLKKIGGDLEKIEAYVLANRALFKRGLALLSSVERDFWRDYHLSVPFKNEMIVDNSPYVKPLLDIMHNYGRYAVLLVEKEVARLFLMQLGQMEEYDEVRSEGVPGKHRRGGLVSIVSFGGSAFGSRRYSSQEKSFERHVDYHVTLHLKDVLKHLETFLSAEDIGNIVLGGSDEAVEMVTSLLPQPLSSRIIGTFRAEMAGTTKDILEKVRPVVSQYEKSRDSETVRELLTKALKNENAVLGIENVLNALQEGRIMRLVVMQAYGREGLSCVHCGYLSAQEMADCPYCKNEMEKANYLVDLIAQKAIEQGAVVEMVSENSLAEAGSIGAFLRF